MAMDNSTSIDQEMMPMTGSLQPSDTQERLLAFLPIPSALLSVFGSSMIIYMVFKSRQERKLTPYLRLLFAMSVYDIVYSLIWCVAAFLRPEDTSPRVLSLGNKTTCNVLGFINELSHGTIIYQGMLGLYFLLTARYGYSNSYIASRIEPWMHIISIGYPLCFATAEALLDGYGEVIMGIGCWVVVTTENCTNNFLCAPRILRYLSCAIPLFIGCVSLIVVNRTILLYAREQMMPAFHGTSRSFALTNNITRFSSKDDADQYDDSEDSSTTEPQSNFVFTGTDRCKNETGVDILTGSVRTLTHFNKDQARRLKLVSSQTVLFVVSFLSCNIWTGITGLIEDSGDSLQADLAMLVRTYPVFALQAIFSPLQGFFNLMVFIRPKYLKYRHLHEEESRLWVIRRSIFGEEVKPTILQSQRRSSRTPNPFAPVDVKTVPKTKPQAPKSNQVAPSTEAAPSNQGVPSATRLPRGMVSDLTASQGDFDHVMQEADDKRWEDTTENSRNAPLISHRKRSSLLLCTSTALSIISENQESVFEALPVLPGSEDLVEDVFSPRTVHRRWSSESLPQVRRDENPKKQEVGLSIPARVASAFDSSTDDPPGSEPLVED
ncbi:MAG: hypothetical protein SGBAC_008832, partial [Bacillariaceae sp.]